MAPSGRYLNDGTPDSLPMMVRKRSLRRLETSVAARVPNQMCGYIANSRSIRDGGIIASCALERCESVA
jgi:hypothetical protein